MKKSWIGEAIGKRAPSASYQSYQGKKSQNIDSQGAATNALPPGNRIGPKNKTKGYSMPSKTDSMMDHVFDKRISGKGYGSNSGKVSFDPTAKRAPFAPSPTSKKGSSGKKGPSKFVGSR